eukprot:3851405-Alexandrium_andersonii.AAC.1
MVGHSRPCPREPSPGSPRRACSWATQNQKSSRPCNCCMDFSLSYYTIAGLCERACRRPPRHGVS